MNKYIKYPRTYHLNFGQEISRDDRMLLDNSQFKGKRVIISEKLDGENCNFYNNYYHARSIDSQHHQSRNWIKNFHSQISHNIPKGWRICGENLYAKHSIFYNNLKSYFYMFSIWNDKNECLNWEETIEWSYLLGVEFCPILYDGIWNEEKIKKLCNNEIREGFVARLYDSFSYENFNKSIAKFIHKKFKDKLDENEEHWRNKIVIPNRLKDEK